MKLKLKPIVLLLGLIPTIALASSHREAPFISTMPQLDASDFYMFMSYEHNRTNYVTLLANYNPLQDAYAGPNFHAMSDRAVYDFRIDNNGDAKSDMTFRFTFTNTYNKLAVPTGASTPTTVPLINIGAFSAADQSNLNLTQTYKVQLVRDGGASPGGSVTNTVGGSDTFTKPMDNIGNKSVADYETYANKYVYTVNIPGCATPGRLFAGQRKDGFVADLGAIFDLVNLNPLGARDSTSNALTEKNVTTLALEVPVACLRGSSNDPVVGAWTTSFVQNNWVLSQTGTQSDYYKANNFFAENYTQVSRLGSPLVNELVIGLKDKDMFNGSVPSADGQFASYVTNPTLPVLLNVLFGNAAVVPHAPRNDLVSAFLTGLPGLNKPKTVTASEELRLNTGIPATAPAQQNDLGVLGGDLAGFPNGRRPYDDVVDIALRVVEGAICSTAYGTCGDQTADPNHGAAYTDGARSPGPTLATENVTGSENAADTYMDHFPYLNTPVPGSVNASVSAAPASASARANRK
ncbi:DUF4331 domain-containing protein [Rhodanobacter sp. L36]|uniref:DUF4331 domain-containing protein n=1 Tax=Rhodanobacter sp. L36 TaxID=1747221 RepID=UPI00131C71F9|nr:DUF4331 domain-containing protein [Rhodanobacter sp. L36]